MDYPTVRRSSLKPLKLNTPTPKDFIIYEDPHILVCHKPAKMAVETKQVAQKDLESILKNHLSHTSDKPVYLATINRLDQPVEGLILFAKTKKAATELNRQLTQNLITKEYLAILSSLPSQKEGILTDYLLKDGRNNISSVVSPDTPNAKKAELYFQVLDIQKNNACVQIRLKTGRHHQIRVQFSHLGCPLLGDGKYGGTNGSDLCLCSFHLGFIHPITKKHMDFTVSPKNPMFSNFCYSSPTA